MIYEFQIEDSEYSQDTIYKIIKSNLDFLQPHLKISGLPNLAERLEVSNSPLSFSAREGQNSINIKGETEGNFYTLSIDASGRCEKVANWLSFLVREDITTKFVDHIYKSINKTTEL